MRRGSDSPHLVAEGVRGDFEDKSMELCCQGLLLQYNPSSRAAYASLKRRFAHAPCIFLLTGPFIHDGCLECWPLVEDNVNVVKADSRYIHVVWPARDPSDRCPTH